MVSQYFTVGLEEAGPIAFPQQLPSCNLPPKPFGPKRTFLASASA
jgi:hypothetical protein